MSTVIKVEDLGKLYRLGSIGTGTISHDINRWWARVRGKEDPFLKLGSENDRTKKSDSDFSWALRNISFDVKDGEVLGIIGKNGAGKSTLLKILSRTTTPTTGVFKVKGRIASLLEVGTGFHPELTGRENVFLNGAILGMTKNEIRSKFDEIVAFSGVERYIDTPVKRYSSGMYVRLAFAVAAHLEPEILIVDEVLAVGDIEFQKKCLGKMKDVSRQGRTVLFVSHNIPSVKSLCSKVLVLQKGQNIFHGNVTEGIELYVHSGTEPGANGLIPDASHTYFTGEARFFSIELLNSKNESTQEVFFNSAMKFRITIDVLQDLEKTLFDLKINSGDAVIISHSLNSLDGAGLFDFKKGRHVLELEIENHFQPGNYNVTLGIHQSSIGTATIDYVENVCHFKISQVSENVNDYKYDFVFGYVRPKTKWNLIK